MFLYTTSEGNPAGQSDKPDAAAGRPQEFVARAIKNRLIVQNDKSLQHGRDEETGARTTMTGLAVLPSNSSVDQNGRAIATADGSNFQCDPPHY